MIVRTDPRESLGIFALALRARARIVDVMFGVAWFQRKLLFPNQFVLRPRAHRHVAAGAEQTWLSARDAKATFTSVADVARGMGIPSLLIHDRFEGLPVVAAFEGPLLIFHGERDTLVAVSHGRRLASSNARAELVLYDVGHNDLPPPGADYRGASNACCAAPPYFDRLISGPRGLRSLAVTSLLASKHLAHNPFTRLSGSVRRR